MRISFRTFSAISTNSAWVLRSVGQGALFLFFFQQKCLGQFGISETVNNNLDFSACVHLTVSCYECLFIHMKALPLQYY